jgi:hypothetical protein
MSTSTSSPHVWPAGRGAAPAGEPVRDDQARVWTFTGGQYHTADNRHHESPAALHDRTDLVEVRCNGSAR